LLKENPIDGPFFVIELPLLSCQLSLLILYLQHSERKDLERGWDDGNSGCVSELEEKEPPIKRNDWGVLSRKSN
jgi:hypothetical protein